MVRNPLRDGLTPPSDGGLRSLQRGVVRRRAARLPDHAPAPQGGLRVLRGRPVREDGRPGRNHRRDRPQPGRFRGPDFHRGAVDAGPRNGPLVAAPFRHAVTEVLSQPRMGRQDAPGWPGPLGHRRAGRETDGPARLAFHRKGGTVRCRVQGLPEERVGALCTRTRSRRRTRPRRNRRRQRARPSSPAQGAS